MSVFDFNEIYATNVCDSGTESIQEEYEFDIPQVKYLLIYLYINQYFTGIPRI
jgi:hypothetical protein